MGGSKKKLDRARIKRLIFENKTDPEIADIMNCSTVSISTIRTKEFKIHKNDDLYFGKKWRKGSWLHSKGKIQTKNRAYIHIPAKFMRKIDFEPGTRYQFRIKTVLPNSLLLDFRRSIDED